MNETTSIRDELTALLLRHGHWEWDEFDATTVADAVLASPVIRRIQAEAIRDAAVELDATTSHLNPLNLGELAYINCTRIDAQELRHRANRIEKGPSDV